MRCTKKRLLGSLYGLVPGILLTMVPFGTASAQEVQEAQKNPMTSATTVQNRAPDNAADEATDGRPQDIVVTARRKQERLLDVPIAISALTSEGIQARGLKTITDLASFTPGLFVQTDAAISTGRNDRSSTRLTFRGLSVAGGGMFINGVPYGGSGQPDVTDAQRVEVLKGPQAVYFGRSTYSGAVNYVTKDPSAEFGGRVEAEAASYGKYDTRFVLEGPIAGPDLTARASFRRYHTDGQYDNGSSGTKLGEENTTNVTLAITAKPVSNLTLRGYYAYTKDNDGAPPTASLKNGGSGPLLSCGLGGTGRNYYCGELGNVSDLPASYISLNTVMDKYNVSELVQNARGRTDLLFSPSYLNHFGFKQEVHNASLRADYVFDSGWAVSGIGSYSHTKQARLNTFTGRDVSSIPNPYYTAASPSSVTPYYTFVSAQQSEYQEKFFEGRVTSPQDVPIRGTLGTSYYELTRPGEVGYSLSPLGRGNNASAKSGSFTPAVFGGLYIDPIEKLTVTLEGRYQWDKITSQQVYPTVASKFDNTWKSFSPRVSLDYKFTPNEMAYATFSRGYRQGGFNSTLAALNTADLALIVAQVPNAQVNYGQEKLDNYEIGFKGAFFNRRLQATIDLYHMTWSNGQVTNNAYALRPDGSNIGAVITFNQGKVNMNGIEAEGTFAVTRNLTLEGTLQYADNKIKDYPYLDGLKINGSSNVEGNTLDQTPKWAWTVSPAYHNTISGDWDGFARIDYIHRGRIFIDPTNVAYLASRDTFNLRAGVTDKNQGLRLEFYVNNVFDDDKITSAYRGNDVVYRLVGGNVVPGVALTLNELRLGLPQRREVGVRAVKTF